MKQLLNKKGNGVVILTADEYCKIIDEVYKAQRKSEQVLEYCDILEDELELSKKNSNYELAARVSLKTIRDFATVAIDTLENIAF